MWIFGRRSFSRCSRTLSSSVAPCRQHALAIKRPTNNNGTSWWRCCSASREASGGHFFRDSYLLLYDYRLFVQKCTFSSAYSSRRNTVEFIIVNHTKQTTFVSDINGKTRKWPGTVCNNPGQNCFEMMPWFVRFLFFSNDDFKCKVYFCFPTFIVYTVKSGKLLVFKLKLWWRITDSSFKKKKKKKKCFVWGLFTCRKLKILACSYLICKARWIHTAGGVKLSSCYLLIMSLDGWMASLCDDGGLKYLTLFAERAVWNQSGSAQTGLVSLIGICVVLVVTL